MQNERFTPKNNCPDCTRRDMIIIELSTANDERRREIERLEKGLKAVTPPAKETI